MDLIWQSIVAVGAVLALIGSGAAGGVCSGRRRQCPERVLDAGDVRRVGVRGPERCLPGARLLRAIPTIIAFRADMGVDPEYYQFLAQVSARLIVGLLFGQGRPVVAALLRFLCYHSLRHD
ncbi:hypothetical protein GRS96_16890 [Rathayibacter sp. VKM Ac-2803]|uniref:hypothetical protein n=1 Tax=Rathayibacter sp. VKM Ac-2803 TaxID=2609256 RepID=UPI00135BE373|nr:hypothetical protein [Rathayibacter sp. VKM Ac-2803]MWV50949.1 hypothetical protein [Rathayibacter sp. VKM Ac-2803]